MRTRWLVVPALAAALSAPTAAPAHTNTWYFKPGSDHRKELQLRRLFDSPGWGDWDVDDCELVDPFRLPSGARGYRHIECVVTFGYGAVLVWTYHLTASGKIIRTSQRL